MDHRYDHDEAYNPARLIARQNTREQRVDEAEAVLDSIDEGLTESHRAARVRRRQVRTYVRQRATVQGLTVRLRPTVVSSQLSPRPIRPPQGKPSVPYPRGRPTRALGEPTRPVRLTLTDTDIDRLRDLGAGSASEGVRQLLAYFDDHRT